MGNSFKAFVGAVIADRPQGVSPLRESQACWLEQSFLLLLY